MLKQKTRTTPPETEAAIDPRAELRAAVRRHKAAAAAGPALQAARSKLSGQLYEALNALDAATAAIETAREKTAKHRVNEALGKKRPPPSPTIEEAEARAHALENEIESLRSAVATLDARAPEVKKELERAEFGLDQTVRKVVAAETGGVVMEMITEYMAVQHTLYDLAAVIALLSNAGAPIPEANKNWGSGRHWPKSAQLQRWEAAVASLRTDANTPLPGTDAA